MTSILTSSVSKAVKFLSQGEVVAFPTETVYGLGADGTSDGAVAQIYAIKQRPFFNPLIFHVYDLEKAQELGFFSEAALRLAQHFWPGPLTLVVPKKKNFKGSLLATAGLSTIALRIPSHPVVREILKEFGNPLVAPSANLSGLLSSTTATHVYRHLKDKLKIIVEGGACEKGLESTIIDASLDKFCVLRYGALSVEEIEHFIGHSLEKQDQLEAIKAPGQLASHYAPFHLPVRINATDCRTEEIFLGFGQISYSNWNLSPTGDLTEAAAHFFSYMHELDQPGSYIGIAVAPIPNTGLGRAINDRLNRATISWKKSIC